MEKYTTIKIQESVLGDKEKTKEEIDLELNLLRERIEELENLRTKLRDDYRNLRTDERTLVETLNTKYGAGQLDIESGTFQPAV